MKHTMYIATDGGSFKNAYNSKGFDAVYSFVLYVHDDTIQLKHSRSGFIPNATNNYGEICAIVNALQDAYKIISENNFGYVEVVLVTDSDLCKKSLTEWLPKWLENSTDGIMRNSKGEPVANQIQILMAALYIEKLNNIGATVKICHINSHTNLDKVDIDVKKFNSKNNCKASKEEYIMFHKMNDLCDRLVKEEYKINIKQ